ncbi:MAG: phosphocholine cytidylyltransferase family protein [candidate division NC10 bacterium]|nr:phosphocholine cytidylyltransferase family protein [candidate division NC10 bacterium]MBI2114104.1 phosphocholine cytidylyltransferase family protein [candidate division NC10 bacterium]
MRAIVLVAGVGWRLKPHTETTPKCLMEIGGKSLLRRYLDAFAALGVDEAILVVGHLKEQIMAEASRGPAEVEARFVSNEQFTRGNILSLWHARHEFDDDILLMDGDVLYPRELLARLIASPDSNAIAVDERFQDTGEEQKVVCEDGWVVEVTKKISGDPRIRGEAVGILRLSADAAEVLRGILEEFIETGKDSLEYEDALRELAAEVPIGVVEVGDLPWVEIDFEDDLARAREQILPAVDRLDRGEAVPSP